VDLKINPEPLATIEVLSIAFLFPDALPQLFNHKIVEIKDIVGSIFQS